MSGSPQCKGPESRDGCSHPLAMTPSFVSPHLVGLPHKPQRIQGSALLSCQARLAGLPAATAAAAASAAAIAAAASLASSAAPAQPPHALDPACQGSLVVDAAGYVAAAVLLDPGLQGAQHRGKVTLGTGAACCRWGAAAVARCAWIRFHAAAATVPVRAPTLLLPVCCHT